MAGRAQGGGEKGKVAQRNGANLGFEAELFLAADKLRKNLESSDYKHVVLGLVLASGVDAAMVCALVKFRTASA